MFLSFFQPKSDTRRLQKKAEVSCDRAQYGANVLVRCDCFAATLTRVAAAAAAAAPQLLTALKGLGRGVNASDEDKARVEKLAAALEKENPTKNVLSAALSAKWRLEYTTSDAILGTARPPFLRPYGDIYQTIDAENLTARNQETVPFFNAVAAELTPTSKDAVDVQFKTFYILGFIPVQAPPSARGPLQITYLDEDLRISRGNKQNLFVLSR
jgi:hypothetical protein